MRLFKAILSTSRANLLLASIGHATLGMFLAAHSLGELASLKALLFVLLHYSIAITACNMNSLSDLEVDRRYKRYISDGVDALGRGRMLGLIALFFILSALLAAYFLLAGYIITAALATLGLACALAYSLRPLRLKGRGMLSPVPILFGLYMLPLLGGWFLFRSDLTPLFLIFLIGYALMNQGFTLVNTCEDYSEDRAEGVRTWAHILGLERTLKLAYAMAFMGLLCPAAMLLMASLGTQPAGSVSVAALMAMALASLMTVAAAAEVRESGKGPDLEKSAKTYGRRFQRWFLMTRYPLMLAAIMMLL